MRARAEQDNINHPAYGTWTADFMLRRNESRAFLWKSLRAAAPEWTFEQINFVARKRGAVAEDDFYNKLEKLNAQAGKRVRHTHSSHHI